MFNRIIRSLAALLLLGPVVVAQAQLTTTVGVNSSETGVFTNTQLNQTNQFLVGGETPSTVWTGSSKFTDGITTILKFRPARRSIRAMV